VSAMLPQSSSANHSLSASELLELVIYYLVVDPQFTSDVNPPSPFRRSNQGKENSHLQAMLYLQYYNSSICYHSIPRPVMQSSSNYSIHPIVLPTPRFVVPHTRHSPTNEETMMFSTQPKRHTEKVSKKETKNAQ
jgi:hypothetical protein